MSIAPELSSPKVIRHVEHAMGTVFSFDVRLSGAARKEHWIAISTACARLHRADAIFSTWKRNSPINLLRRGEITLDRTPPAVQEVLRHCEVARELSQGWFDPWAMPGGVDPTGLVKGWATEDALEQLRVEGIEAAMVNGGGDIATFGSPRPGRPWRIGVRDAFCGGKLLCIVETDRAVATSGTYERGRHFVDPRTGRLQARAIAATVSGPDLSLADALATALVTAGIEGLGFLEGSGYDGLVVSHNGEVQRTRGFAAIS